MRNKKRLKPTIFLLKNRKGTTLLIENIVFIILNLVFIAILIFFLVSKSGGAAVLEEKYAKEIALVLDSAKPGMMITLGVGDAIKSGKSGLGENNIDNIISINKNVVTVKLRENGGYSYSFFNNISITNSYLNKADEQYVFFVGDSNG
jgi:hypothetical protein